jgi:hypothetical protein
MISGWLVIISGSHLIEEIRMADSETLSARAAIFGEVQTCYMTQVLSLSFYNYD